MIKNSSDSYTGPVVGDNLGSGGTPETKHVESESVMTRKRWVLEWAGMISLWSAGIAIGYSLAAHCAA